VLNKLEHAASLRVLRALRTPVCSSTVLTMAPDDLSAYVRLARFGYVATVDDRPAHKASSSFRWNRIAATPSGLEYLRQIEH